MKRLIVNADDFGLSELTNKGIFDCFKHGIVTSTTIMANGKAFDHAVKLAKEHNLNVGVHLNLTTGKPLTKAKKIVENNEFTKKNIVRAMFNIIDSKEVEVEFKAQIKKVINAGIKPTHIDGHMHSHIFPGTVDIVIKLAKKYNIKKIRPPMPRVVNYKLMFSKSLIKKLLLDYFIIKTKKKLKKAGIKTVDRFYGVLESGRLTTANLKKILKNTKGTAELMTHPGYHDRDISSILKETRELELRTLTSQEAKEIIKKENIKLISYKEL